MSTPDEKSMYCQELNRELSIAELDRKEYIDNCIKKYNNKSQLFPLAIVHIRDIMNGIPENINQRRNKYFEDFNTFIVDRILEKVGHKEKWDEMKMVIYLDPDTQPKGTSRWFDYEKFIGELSLDQKGLITALKRFTIFTVDKSKRLKSLYFKWEYLEKPIKRIYLAVGILSGVLTIWFLSITLYEYYSK